jgi:hypothetical protein
MPSLRDKHERRCPTWGHRVCLTATATILELAPIWVHWHDVGVRQLPMCVRGSPYGTLRSMPLVAKSTDTFCSKRPSCAPPGGGA